MDRKCSVFIAASVDGFITRIDGDIEWLHRPEYECAALKGLSYDEFMTTVDAIVMGRKTLDKVLSFPQWPYDNTPVVVLSHGEVALPQELRSKIDVLAGDPAHIVEQLAARGLKHLYIDGGQTIQAFLAAGHQWHGRIGAIQRQRLVAAIIGCGRWLCRTRRFHGRLFAHWFRHRLFGRHCFRLFFRYFKR